MVQELLQAAVSGKEEGYRTQYPVQEYMLNQDGLPMTPDVGTVIGSNTQNRLCTADINDDIPPVPTPGPAPLVSHKLLSIFH